MNNILNIIKKMLLTTICIILMMAGYSKSKPIPVDVDLGEVKRLATNFNSQTTVCVPVTPPCFVCTSPTTKASQRRDHCNDPPLVFKFTKVSDPCVTDNPCTCTTTETKTTRCRTTPKCTTPKCTTLKCHNECRSLQTGQPALAASGLTDRTMLSMDDPRGGDGNAISDAGWNGS